jgi:hypothetical protein
MIVAIAKYLGRLLRAAYRVFLSLLFTGLLVLNISMIAIPAVYNFVSGLFWGAVELVSEGYAQRSATRVVSRRDVEDAEFERRNTRAALQSGADERNRLRDENAAALRRISQLEPIQTEVEELRLQNRSASRVITSLQDENNVLATRIESIQSELQDSRATQQRVSSQLDNLRAENQLLNNRAESLNSELDTSRNVQREIRGEVAAISTRMQQRSIRMVARNTSLIATESLPLIGVAAIFGGLALDINDTCEQMRDLSELDRLINDLSESAVVFASPSWCGLSASDIFNRLYPGGSTPEKLCIEARLRTRTINPPECRSIDIEV